MRSESAFGTRFPHSEQSCEVYAGFTAISTRAALSAFCVRMLRNIRQLASERDLFKPDLRLAPLGRYSPVASSWMGAGRFDIFLTLRSSKAINPKRLTSFRAIW